MSLVSRYRRWVGLLLALFVLTISVAAFAPAALGLVAPARHDDNNVSIRPCRNGDPFLRTELFFGSEKPDGSEVTEAEFMRFLDNEITPRFPDGLTLLTGLGQFRGSNGVIVKETSRVLILLYPPDVAREANQNIEQIRRLFKRQFQQESVLRADDPLPQCVSF
jgi:hypothetical protein